MIIDTNFQKAFFFFVWLMARRICKLWQEFLLHFLFQTPLHILLHRSKFLAYPRIFFAWKRLSSYGLMFRDSCIYGFTIFALKYLKAGLSRSKIELVSNTTMPHLYLGSYTKCMPFKKYRLWINSKGFLIKLRNKKLEVKTGQRFNPLNHPGSWVTAERYFLAPKIFSVHPWPQS